jgi:uncharacterized Zn-finger protein
MIRARSSEGAKIVATQALEVVEADQPVVRCDGGGGPLGHPAVYLNMGEKGEILCPYCSRRFVLRQGAGGRGGH